MNEQDIIEQDIAEQKIKELKEQGFKNIYERDRYKQYKRVTQEYERYLNCPYG